jgi:outer membrane protein assembly factor BamB
MKTACLSRVLALHRAFPGALVALVFFLSGSAQAGDWPQWRGTERDGVWRETGIVNQFDEPQIPLRWRVPVAAGYCSPTVADGRVYLTDRITKPEQQERVQCFDWETGKSLWTYTYDCTYRNVGYRAGPRASVTVFDNRAYALGTMGHLHCFDATTGKLLWKKDMAALYNIEIPVWGIAAAPLVEDNLVILHIGGTPEACIVALDRKTGEERWTALSDRASYSAPIIIQQAGKRVLVCWTGDHVAGLNPQTGAVYWQHPFTPVKMVIGVPTPVFSDNRLFVSSFYDGSLMLRVNPNKLEVAPIWRRRGQSEKKTESLHCMISTPVVQGDYVYGVDSYGEFRCLDAGTGDRIWEDTTAVPLGRWSTMHLIPHEDKVWLFTERGELMITTLSPKGLTIHSRAQLIKPTTEQLPRRGGVSWSHPAFAYKHIFVRNDEELVCADLSQ